MFKHYLLTIARQLWKRRLYSLISLVSLTLRCLGLYGLMSVAQCMQMKANGVRKVLLI